MPSTFSPHDIRYPLQFKNKLVVLNSKDDGRTNRFEEEIFVRAPETIAHGDSKTQMVRSKFMGLMKGEVGTMIGMFHNMYGRYVTIERLDGEHFDCLPHQLEVIDSATYEFAKLPEKFLYRTSHSALREFEYPIPIAVGHDIEVEAEPGRFIHLRVIGMTHVIRTVAENKYTPIRVRLIVEEL